MSETAATYNAQNLKYHHIQPAWPETIVEAIAITRIAQHISIEEMHRRIALQQAALLDSQQYWVGRK